MPVRVAQIEREMRRAGLRCTEQRRLALACLAELPGHFGAEEVLEALRQENGSPQGQVSRATLYRLLGELERIGVLRRVLLSEGHGHYEFTQEGQSHCHVVCSRCGRVAEVRDATLERAVCQLALAEGFAAEQAEVEITVVCRGCRPGAEAAAGKQEDLST